MHRPNLRKVLDCASPLALLIALLQPKAPEGWRSPRRCSAEARFMAPMRVQSWRSKLPMRSRMPRASSRSLLAVPCKNLRLTSKPSSLYYKVVMKMSGEFVVSQPSSSRAAGKVERRHIFEMLLAFVCPPLLAITTVISMFVWLENVAGIQAFRGYSQILVPLSVTGAILLSTIILLDLRANERLSALSAADVRLALCVSALVSLVFLAVWVTTQAGRDNSSYNGEIVMFICLPMLLVCAPLLWYSARAIQRTSLRVLLLAGFVTATVWAECQCQTANQGSPEERALMFNSLLVALALTIRLCAWGATEFRRVEGGGT